MVEVAGYRVGEVELARVPYFDIALDPGTVHVTAEQIAAIDGATPYWASPDHQVLIGQAVWVIVSHDRVIVVDPCLAADQFLRSGPEAVGHQEAVFAALRDAGFPPERVDVVVLSHLDGMGMAAAVAPDGSWEPAFPNARVLMTAAELDWLAGPGAATGPLGLEALNALVAQGAVDRVDDGHEITDEVRIELTGAHSPGHAVVRVDSEGEHATFIGHLALSPINVVDGEPAHEAEVLARLVEEAAARDGLLVGPLWPYPGAAYANGDRVLIAAD